MSANGPQRARALCIMGSERPPPRNRNPPARFRLDGPETRCPLPSLSAAPTTKDTNHMAAHGNRSILGPINPYDNGLKAASYAPGGDDSLDRPVNPAPAGGDQGSTDSLDQRQAQAQAFREAQRVAGAFVGDGAAGSQLGRGPDAFSRDGQIADADGSGPADVIAPEPPVVLRRDGADPGVDGTGKTIG
jgi:hypothetical protein